MFGILKKKDIERMIDESYYPNWENIKQKREYKKQQILQQISDLTDELESL